MCFLHSEDQYTDAEPEAKEEQAQEDNRKEWRSVHDLIALFTAVEVSATKAVKLWKHGVRSPSRLSLLTPWEIEAAAITEDDKEHLLQFLESRKCTSTSSTRPLRSDHPVVAPTLRGSRVGAKLALRTAVGRAAALEDIDNLLDAPSARNNATHRWETWCELLDPFGERPLPVTAEKVRMVAAGLRKGGFRSASRYFGAATIEHLKAYGHRPGCLVSFAMTRYARAVSRGVGPSACKESFKIEDLVDCMTPPDPEAAAARPKTDSIWPCGAACLGAWWMTRSIEMTAARVKDFVVDETSLRVHWALPASKTDVQAHGVSRSHKCICKSHQALERICPFHIAVSYLLVLKNAFPDLDNFGDLPLFPNGNGSPLTHSASVRLIRFAAASAGDVLAPQPGRFGEHTLRVSGAQFMSRVLQMDVYVIQLYVRRASKTVARYVQDAPLTRPLPAAAHQPFTLEIIVKMVTDLMDRKFKLADAIKTVTQNSPDTQAEALQSEMLAVIDKKHDENGGPEVRVINKATKVTHIVLQGPELDIMSDKFLARCGWKFGLVRHSFPADGVIPTNKCKTCFGEKKKRTTASESSESSSSSSDS